MKKYLAIISIILGMFAVAGCSSEDYKSADIIVFTQKGCPYCDDALKFIENTVKVKRPKLKIVILDVADIKNAHLMLEYAKKYNVDQSHLGTPFIISGSKHFVGWEETSGRKLMKTIKLR